MNGKTLLPGSGAIVGLKDLNWQAAGTGDYNGDGQSDLLWRHAVTGQNVVWFMNGKTLLPGSGAIVGLKDLNWQAAGTGDYNGDGQSDLLWRHAVTGQNVVWFMNGKTLLSGSGPIPAPGDPNWQLIKGVD
jgi:uncharacterized protein YcsI (UPF0317 family)